MYDLRAEEQPEEMTLSQAALDAEWKRIQKKTFTRWCNEHLKKQGVQIEDLTTDFADGINLIVLLEVLSQKKVGRYSKKPRVHAQRMENIETALDFIMKKERIRLVNIGEPTSYYYDLVVHYSITDSNRWRLYTAQSAVYLIMPHRFRQDLKYMSLGIQAKCILSPVCILNQTDQ